MLDVPAFFEFPVQYGICPRKKQDYDHKVTVLFFSEAQSAEALLIALLFFHGSFHSDALGEFPYFIFQLGDLDGH